MAVELSLRDVIERLEQNLKAEKQALLDGDYHALAAVMQESEHLSDALEALLLTSAQEQVFRKRLAAIVRLAQENERLIRAAKTGVAAAKARFKDIINRQRNIGVYSETGERPFVPGATVTRQKLA